MTLQEIEAALSRGISTIANRDVSEFTPDRPFHDLGVDSLGFVEILVFIEKTFKLELIGSDLTKNDFATVRTLAAFIDRSLK
jgi:acyl carrier protein